MSAQQVFPPTSGSETAVADRWLIALPPFVDPVLAHALMSFHLPPDVVTFIHQHMLMEEKRAILRYLLNGVSFKSLRELAKRCGRSEDLLQVPLDQLVRDGIVVVRRTSDGDLWCGLSDDPATRSLVRRALTAYERNPELRRVLAEFTMG
ncbi:MAG: hypothetical protein Kow0047_02320 [Anaerolineae bacterium]